VKVGFNYRFNLGGQGRRAVLTFAHLSASKMEKSGRCFRAKGHLGETISIMSPVDQKKRQCAKRHPPFECTALLLQGGGALGAYQAGVYEALSEAGIHPDWVAGISIGAVNSAIIAGNPPEKRVEGLRRFWERITSDVFGSCTRDFLTPLMNGDWVRGLLSQVSANSAMLSGASGFFVPRLPSPWLQPRGSIEATSFYDASRLKNTLESLVDFDRINAREMRFSVGAVNVRSGNFVYFDSTTHTIRPEHVMASGALPPGFAAIEIDGERYWDGGLISNTPLQWVLDSAPRQDTLAFQVDLWSARGDFPGNMAEVETRQKEIQYRAVPEPTRISSSAHSGYATPSPPCLRACRTA
jgi:NTE family protein